MGKIVLAHISDLHFGSRILNDRFTGIPHRIGHDKVLALGLMTALEDLPVHSQINDPINVVVSGDLTRAGSESEFAVAHTLLRSTARLTQVAPPDFLGYSIADDQFASVPGNHDQYGAGFMATQNPAVTGVHFEVTPWHRRFIDSNDQVTLDLFGIDTNSGFILVPQGGNVLAWGGISSQQFTQLENLLIANLPVQGRTVRALMMHHSLSYRSGTVGALVWMSALLPFSKLRLERICANHGIAAILTGHTHTMLCKQLQARTTGGTQRTFWELRSWSTLVGPRKINGFLAHEISNNPRGGVSWDTYAYPWRSGSFRRQAQAVASFVV
jgi:3',5'-cyclic AMP phosphodiesterase CpdA